MDIKKSRLYPHPVLTNYSNDFIDSEFTVDVKQEKVGEALSIHFKVNLNNEQLKEMIKKQLATLVFHVENPITCYRKIFKSWEEELSIKIPYEKLNERISVCTFIVSNTDISIYSNKNFNPDYENISFDVKKGNILGIAPQIKIHIDKERDQLKKIPSIFSIIKIDDPDLKTMKIEIASERIKLFLGKVVFEKYQQLSMNVNYLPILHLGLVFPALVYALDAIQYDGIEDYEEQRWFRSIKKNMTRNGVDLDREYIRMKTSFVLAQELLDYPLVKGFENLLIEGDDEE